MTKIDYFLALGKKYDLMIREAQIDKCNCMVRYNGGAQLPAVRRGKQFFSPEGDEITCPDSFENMDRHAIRSLMAERGEVYIGHMFGAFKP